MTEALVLTRDDKKRNTRAWVIAIAIPLAIILAALMVYRASFAAFTATTQTGNTPFSTGQVVFTNDKVGTAAFTATNLMPGETGSGTIKVTYKASRTANVRLYATSPSDTDLSSKINLTITNSRDADTFTGTLAAFQETHDWATGVVEVAMPADAETDVDYTVTWTVADNAPQGKTASVTFVWEAQG